MTRLLIIMVLLFVASMEAQKASAPSSSQPDKIASDELVTLTNEWVAAINAKDRAKLEALMAPDYALYGWNGEKWAARLEWLDNLLNHIKIDAYSHQNIAAQVYGSIANVTSVGNWKGSFDGKAFDERDIVVDTWRRADGHWQVVSRITYPEPIETPAKH